MARITGDTFNLRHSNSFNLYHMAERDAIDSLTLPVTPLVARLHNAIVCRRDSEVKETIANSPVSTLLERDRFGHTALTLAGQHGSKAIYSLIRRLVREDVISKRGIQ